MKEYFDKAELTGGGGGTAPAAAPAKAAPKAEAPKAGPPKKGPPKKASGPPKKQDVDSVRFFFIFFPCYSLSP